MNAIISDILFNYNQLVTTIDSRVLIQAFVAKVAIHLYYTARAWRVTCCEGTQMAVGAKQKNQLNKSKNY